MPRSDPAAPRFGTAQHLLLVFQSVKLGLESGLRQFDILEAQSQLARGQLLRTTQSGIS